MNNQENHEANLLNNSISYDYMMDKSKREYKDDHHDNNDNDGKKNVMDEIMKNLDKLPNTETDMLFQYMANPDKLKSQDQVQFFEKDAYTHHETQDKHHNESINDYVNKDQDQKGYGDDNHNTPKASAYGPSYGDGPAYGNGLSQGDMSQPNDKYCGFATEEDLNLAKLDMLRKLGELMNQHGVKLSQNYSMNSDYKAMKYEYELHRSIRDKHNGVKWMSNLLLNVTWGLEIANDAFNPFEFTLKGWSEQMNDDIDEYYDVLGELYEKYFKSGKPIPPEFKLLFMMGASAVKFHIAHTALGKIPNLSEALSQNPELAKKLNEQAISENIKKQNEKQKETFGKKLEEQHETARKKSEELQIIKDKQSELIKSHQKTQESQKEFMEQHSAQQQFIQQQMFQQQVMQQQLLEKQKNLEILQKQLNQQRSDTRSMYTNNTHTTEKKKGSQRTMQPPVIPESLKNKFSLKRKEQNISDYNDAMNIGIGALMMNDGNKININPEVEDIINNKLNDTHSVISDNDSFASKDSRSNASKKSRKRSTLKVKT
jgi:hypothetical protein